MQGSMLNFSIISWALEDEASGQVRRVGEGGWRGKKQAHRGGWQRCPSSPWPGPPYGESGQQSVLEAGDFHTVNCPERVPQYLAQFFENPAPLHWALGRSPVSTPWAVQQGNQGQGATGRCLLQTECGQQGWTLGGLV